MIAVFFFIVLFFGINQLIFGFFTKEHPYFDRKKMNLLYLYHCCFYGIYLWYVQNSPSDSVTYFKQISTYAGSWFDLFGTDTTFIVFLGYPFYHLGFSTYETLMFLFSWFGYLGFVYAYLFFRENIPLKVKVFKYVDLLTLVLFLPNMHFWTVSVAKGSSIFLGLMMFTYAIAKPKKRVILLILGSFIVFHIRPHVFMFLAVGAVFGYMTGKEKISFTTKIIVFIGMLGTLIAAQDQILAVVNLDGSENLVSDFQSFTDERSENLSQGAGSGVDMASYPLPLKLFTFWFRPLFFDAPSALGLIVSFENLLYLLLFGKLVKKDFIRFIRKAPSLVKMSFVIFFLTSFAMTFVMSNLGIIMRQKSPFMYYLFFVLFYYLAQKKYKRIMKLKKIRAKMETSTP